MAGDKVFESTVSMVVTGTGPEESNGWTVVFRGIVLYDFGAFRRREDAVRWALEEFGRPVAVVFGRWLLPRLSRLWKVVPCRWSRPDAVEVRCNVDTE